MSRSVISKASNASSKMLEEIANRSQNKYIKLIIVESIELKEHSMTNRCVSYGILWDYTSAVIYAWAEESMYQN